MQRDRFIQAITSQHRLANEAERLRQQARTLPAGKKRDALLRKARQIDTALAHQRMAVVSGPANAAVRRTRAIVPQASIYLCENTQADPERYDD
jgi:hypothetical protein